MALLLKGARLVDPAAKLDGVYDMVVRDGKIAEIGEGLSIPKGVERDLSGKIIIPGLIDMHVHLREPGQEYKEDIESGTRAAAKGGFVGVCPMPNTNPVCDDGSKLQFVVDAANEAGHCRVYPVGAITHGLQGKVLAEMGDMVAHGAVAFSDDGHGVQDDGVMRRAMDYAKLFPRPLLSHCQREDLVGHGVVNEGIVSTRLGLAGWPAQGEEIQIARDIALCELTGCHLHIQHVSTARGVQLIADAKQRGLPVSGEATPHHLFLCEDDIDVKYDTNLKMNPPLRTKEDMQALQEALIDGTIDCVASDHAPHAAHEKMLEFEVAPFGTIGLETSLPLVIENLVRTKRMDWNTLVERMAHAPRRILSLPAVELRQGSIADLTVIDPDASFVVGENGFESKARNSAFLGQKLHGMAYDVYMGGYATLEAGKIVQWQGRNEA